MAFDGIVLSVPALWSVAVPVEQRYLADVAEYVLAHQRLAGARRLLLRTRPFIALGVESRYPLGRALVPDFRIFVPADGVPGASERSLMAVPAASLLPDLCRPGTQRTAAVLFMAEYRLSDRFCGIADNGFETFEEILVRIPLHALNY